VESDKKAECTTMCIKHSFYGLYERSVNIYEVRQIFDLAFEKEKR
jgi:hypothetical protein